MIEKAFGMGVAAALVAGLLTVSAGAASASAQEIQEATDVPTAEEIVVEESPEAPAPAPEDQVPEAGEVVPETAPVPEATDVPEQQLPQTAALPSRAASWLGFTFRPEGLTASTYEDGWFAQIDVQSYLVDAPTPFEGTFSWTREDSDGSVVELGSEDVSFLIVPGESFRHVSSVKDPNAVPGEDVRYVVSYTEAVPVQGDPSRTVEVQGRMTGASGSGIKAGQRTQLSFPQLDGKSRKVGNASFRIDGKIAAGAQGLDRRPVVERLDTKTKQWLKHADAAYDRATGAVSYTVPGSVSGTFRISVPEHFGWLAATSGAVVLDRAPTKVSIQVFSVAYPHQIAGYKNSLTAVVGAMTATKGQTLQLQRYDSKSKKWVGHGASRAAKAGKHSFALPTGSKSSSNSTTQYRVHLSPGGFHSESVSKARKVFVQNPARMSKLEKEFYGHSKKYCPAVAVRADSKKVRWGAWGSAEMHENVYYVKTSVPKKHRKTVALHECAHFKQVQAAKSYKGGFSAMQKKLDSVYGKKPKPGFEYQADCIANSWSKNSYWGYHGSKKCGSKLQKQWTKAVAAGRLP